MKERANWVPQASTARKLTLLLAAVGLRGIGARICVVFLTVTAIVMPLAGKQLPAEAGAATSTSEQGIRARARPNLVVTSVSNLPSGLAEGDSFNVSDRTRNKGKATAGRSETRYYLSKDPALSLRNRERSTTDPRTSPTDILLIGARKVGSLGPGKSSQGQLQVEVPGGTPTDTYYLLACADDRGRVRESREDDNCKASEQGQEVAAAQSGDEARIDAFSDTFQPLQPIIEDALPPILRQLCTPTRPRKLSLDKAIASANGFLRRTAGADAMAAFRQSVDYRSAADAEVAAGEAILSGAPGAALASLLRAHRLEPREASHLVNAAGVATSVGLPNEALAFLDEALGLDDRNRPAMGISRQAIALANRGHALFQTGKYASAQQALQSGLAIDPLLSEAQGTLAVVKACRGQDPIPAFRKARHRQNPPPPPDDSEGEITELRPFQFPAFPKNAYANARGEDYIRLNETENARAVALVDRQNLLRANLDQAMAAELPITQRRTSELMLLGIQVADHADLKALWDQFDAGIAESQDAIGEFVVEYQEFVQEATEACDGEPGISCFVMEMRSRCIPAANLTHQQWSNAATSAYQAAGRFMREYSRRLSGIASHLKEPSAYELLLSEITVRDLGFFGGALQTTAGWSGFLSLARAEDDTGEYPLCIEGPEPAAPEDPGDVIENGPGECPPEVKSFNFVADLGLARVKVNCSTVEVEASTKGWIQAFAGVSYDRRAGETTIFAGAKGEVGLGPLEGDFKSGVYIKSGTTGFTDVGWRVGPNIQVSSGPVEFGKSDYMDLSFVGAVSTLGL